MKHRLLLNVVVQEGTAILQLFADEDQALRVRWEIFLVLDFRFYIVEGVLDSTSKVMFLTVRVSTTDSLLDMRH